MAIAPTCTAMVVSTSPEYAVAKGVFTAIRAAMAAASRRIPPADSSRMNSPIAAVIRAGCTGRSMDVGLRVSDRFSQARQTLLEGDARTAEVEALKSGGAELFAVGEADAESHEMCVGILKPKGADV